MGRAPGDRPTARLPWRPAAHLSQTITGFQLLERQGLIRCEWGPSESPYLDGLVVPVEVDGVRLFFDESDGYSWDPTVTEAENLVAFKARMRPNSFYFKRAFHPDMLTDLPEGTSVHPLGLNYQVLPLYYPSWRDAGEVVKVALKKSQLFRRVTGTSRQELGYREFENLPIERQGAPESGRLLFATRLWDPDGTDVANEEHRQERIELNRARIAIVRALKQELGPKFLGGFAPTEAAHRLAPDLLLPAGGSEKRLYVDQAKRASVVGVSQGLFRSIGWRMGELVAAARPIITDQLVFDAGEGFADGTNYLAFGTPEEAPAAALRLLDDDEARARMRWANHLYYQTRLRPDLKVLRALETAGIMQ